MKVKSIEKNGSVIIFSFYEYYGKEILGELLKYLFSSDSYYYMIFGEYMGGYDLSAYKSKYPLADEESGILQLKEEDYLNIDFIYKMLNSYHTASLYINKDPDFLLNLDNNAWRTFSPSLRNGYEIDMLLEYINLRIDNNYSSWTPEFIHNVIGFEIMEEIELKYPVFIFNPMGNTIENNKLQYVVLEKKKNIKVRESLIESSFFQGKRLIDSNGDIYEIERMHIVDDRPIFNLIFHRHGERWFYVEFEYKTEKKHISFDDFKSTLVNMLDKRCKEQPVNHKYLNLITDATSFIEVARLVVKHKLAKSRWDD